MTLQATLGPAKSPAPVRHLRSVLGVVALVLGLGAAQSALSTPITLTFDDVPEQSILTTQYQGLGVTISGARTVSEGVALWPANSGAYMGYSPTGPMSFTLNSAITGDIQSVSVFVSVAYESVGMYAYDAANALLGQEMTAFVPLGGWYIQNQFFIFTSTGNPITRVDFLGGGENYSIDTLSFATAADAATVPEPGTALLLGIGILGLMGVARRKETAAIRRHLLSVLGGLALVLGLGAGQSALASTTTLTFDGYVDGTDITTQYQGLGITASGASVALAFDTPWPANSGANVAMALSGLMAFSVDSAITGNITSVSSYVSGVTSIGIYAYDLGGSLVGQSLTPGATDNMFLTVASSGNPIASIAIHDGGSSFAIDTLTFNSVPEPATAWLLGFGLLGLLGLQSVVRRKENSAMRRQRRSLLGGLALVLGLAAAPPVLATPTTLTFDDVLAGEVLTNQYQSVGVTISGANVLNGLFSPWPANSSPNVAYAPTGLMTFSLNSGITGDIQSVSAYISGETSVGIYGYDAGGALVGQELTPGATDNMLLSFTSSGNPIASIAIHDGGGSFVIDTLTFTSVPEPATAWLLGFGLLGLMGNGPNIQHPLRPLAYMGFAHESPHAVDTGSVHPAGNRSERQRQHPCTS